MATGGDERVLYVSADEDVSCLHEAICQWLAGSTIDAEM